MLDNISDKGMALASSQVQNRIKQLNTKYNSLCSKAQVCCLGGRELPVSDAIYFR